MCIMYAFRPYTLFKPMVLHVFFLVLIIIDAKFILRFARKGLYECKNVI